MLFAFTAVCTYCYSGVLLFLCYLIYELLHTCSSVISYLAVWKER